MRPWIPVSDEPTIEIQSRMVTVGRDKFTAGYAVRYRRRVPAGRILCGPCGKACVPRKDERPHGHKCDPADREKNMYRELKELYATPGKALAAAYDSAA